MRRYLLQSSGFWYAPGEGLADESTPFALQASPAVASGSRRYAELEAAAATPGIAFVALRYGFLYSPGTWFDRNGDMGDQLGRKQVPIIGGGGSVWSWVHIEDAAAATAAALECAPGVYIVDSDPAPQSLWLPAFAAVVGAPAPPQMTEEKALARFGPDTVYYATRLRGAANEKARRELDFRPRRLEIGGSDRNSLSNFCFVRDTPTRRGGTCSGHRRGSPGRAHSCPVPRIRLWVMDLESTHSRHHRARPGDPRLLANAAWRRCPRIKSVG